MRKIYSVSFLLFTSVLLSGCDITGDCVDKEISRKCNPNKSAQAFVTSSDCGATTTPSYGLRIVKGCNPKEQGDRDATVASSSKKMQFQWIASDTLLIRNFDESGSFMKSESINLNGAVISLIY